MSTSSDAHSRHDNPLAGARITKKLVIQVDAHFARISGNDGHSGTVSIVYHPIVLQTLSAWLPAVEFEQMAALLLLLEARCVPAVNHLLLWGAAGAQDMSRLGFCVVALLAVDHVWGFLGSPPRIQAVQVSAQHTSSGYGGTWKPLIHDVWMCLHPQQCRGARETGRWRSAASVDQVSLVHGGYGLLCECHAYDHVCAAGDRKATPTRGRWNRRCYLSSRRGQGTGRPGVRSTSG